MTKVKNCIHACRLPLESLDHQDPGAVHDQCLKKKIMTKFFPWLSQKHERVFSGKYFLKSHGKGVVDGISGKTKAYF